MSDIAIRVENLGKRYHIGETQTRYKTLRESLMTGLHNLRSRQKNESERMIWALKDVSFEVKRGEAIGVIGRNGAGKSTLLKVLAHITRPTTGRVEIHGRVGSLLEVGTGFHPELTGRDNIYLNGAILGMKRAEIERKFDEIVAFAEIEKFLDTPAKHYSSGMYMRLAFAVAAHLEPEILLVDEVLAVGDAEFQKKCLGKMGEVTGEGRTVLFVSHNMAAVQKLCTNVILLKKGQIHIKGDTPCVTNNYLETFADTSLEWCQNERLNNYAYFERISLTDWNGSPLKFITTSASVCIAMEIVIVTKVRNLQVSIGILDSSGSVIFSSSPQDSEVYPPNSPGRYTARVYLPKELFMPKQYYIRTVLWSPDLPSIDSRDVISFLVQETISIGNSTPGGRLGMVAFRCEWNIENKGLSDNE